MAKFQEIAGGFYFPEGPVAMPDGSVILTEIGGRKISRVTPSGAVETLAETGGGPNGAALGPGGLLYVCDNGGQDFSTVQGITFPGGQSADYEIGSIMTLDLKTGAFRNLYTRFGEGMPLKSPNDLVFDRHGGFYFSEHGKMRDRDHDLGGVFYAKADGSFIEEVIFPSYNPNGIGLSPDGTKLYAAETYTCRLTQFNIVAPGKVDDAAGPGGPGIPLYRPAGYKFFDSLAMEASGNICVATIGECGISVVSPAGELVEFVATDDIFTTNIAFGGPDRQDAYITLSGTGRLVKTRWARPGLQLQY